MRFGSFVSVKMNGKPASRTEETPDLTVDTPFVVEFVPEIGHEHNVAADPG